jgi:hypothetical protein
MNIKSCIAAVATFALTTLLAPAFAATVDSPATSASPAQVFGKLLSAQGEEIVAVAEAMPADKYSFTPSGGEFKEYAPSASSSPTLRKPSITSSEGLVPSHPSIRNRSAS